MERIVKKLIELNKTISTMESCTGGGLANAITNIPDASRVIHGAVVTYSNEEKEKEGVSKELIDRYSVYSEEVAKDMAYNVSKTRTSDYGVGDDNVVYIAVYDRENDTFYNKTVTVQYDNRIDKKNQVINETEELLYEILYENKKVL